MYTHCCPTGYLYIYTLLTLCITYTCTHCCPNGSPTHTYTVVLTAHLSMNTALRSPTHTCTVILTGHLHMYAPLSLQVTYTSTLLTLCITYTCMHCCPNRSPTHTCLDGSPRHVYTVVQAYHLNMYILLSRQITSICRQSGLDESPTHVYTINQWVTCT